MASPVRAYLSDSGLRVTLEAGEGEATMWRQSFPVWHLGRQIELYRRLAARKGGRYREHHQPTVEALEAIRKTLVGREREEQHDTEGL